MVPNTFWKLLVKYEVEIPLMQRDYAQGRRDERAPQILRDFLGVLARALDDPANGGVDLDFLYGNVADGKLTLLDGQQRITTLFLLHWYLAGRAGGLTKNCREILARFTYETRVSSRLFCRALAQKAEMPKEAALSKTVTNEQGTEVPDREVLSRSVKDAPWFFRSWVQDPTIRAMLGALDAINEVFAQRDSARAWTFLTGAEPIRFDFLSMRAYALTDELYIKMNARGRALTDFENFKAWLEDHAPREALTEKHRCSIDLGWMDLFWRLRGDADDVGPAYLQFFKGTALNAALARGHRLTEQEITLLNENRYVPTAFYQEHGFFDAATLGQCCGVLDALQGDGLDRLDARLGPLPLFLADKARTSLFRVFISADVTYSDRLLFYALCLFVLDAPTARYANDAVESTSLCRWMRVARNLALNTTVTAETFPGCLETIRSLARDGGCRDIYTRLRGDAPAGRAFSEQMPEERLKAMLLGQDSGRWEAEIHAAEDHPFFRGRIGFLLEFSRDETGVGHNPDRFEEYARKARNIFSEEPSNPTMGSPDYLLPRALTTKRDWAIGVTGGEVYSLAPVTRLRQLWGDQVFRKKENAAALGHILRGIEVGRETDGLYSIIKEWSLGPADRERPHDAAWRDCFIRNPHAVRYGQHHWFRYVSADEIYLLEGKTRNGEHVELRSYTFYKLHIEPDPKVFASLGSPLYWRRPSGSMPPFACLQGTVFETRLLYHRRGTPAEFGFEVRLYANSGKLLPAVLTERLLVLGVGCKPCEDGRALHIPIDGDEEAVRAFLTRLDEVTQDRCPRNAR